MMQTATPQNTATQPAAAMAATQATGAKDLVNKLLTLMGELSQVMLDEMPIIESRDYTNKEHLMRRKQELTMDYQSTLKVFEQNQSLLTQLSKEDIAKLRESGKILDDVTEKNAIALRVAHHATEHLLRVVINEIRKDLHKESGYSGRGVMALAESHHARPISINQRI